MYTQPEYNKPSKNIFLLNFVDSRYLTLNEFTNAEESPRNEDARTSILDRLKNQLLTQHNFTPIVMNAYVQYLYSLQQKLIQTMDIFDKIKDYSTRYWEDAGRSFDIQENIKQRLAYLDSVFDEEENMERYLETKVLLERFFDLVLLKMPPFIGIDNNGQIEAEWHDINEYKIISIRPEREQKITISGLKVTGTILTVITRLEDFINKRDKELQIMLSGILA
jgi:hypothetical protein